MRQHGNGILLVFARTETAWFHDNIFGSPASAILFLRGRLQFHRQDGSLILTKRGKISNAGAPSCLVAYDHRSVSKNNRLALQEAQSRIGGHLIHLW